MNRRQQIVLFLVVLALMVTWFFPHWINRYRAKDDMFAGVAGEGSSVYPHYSFLFTESETELKIGWGRLILTDLIIVAVGAPLVYILRSRP